jgi:hypothetical protein
MIIKENRTVSYIGTVDLSNNEDMSLVKGIRRLVKEANKKQAFGKKPMYVKLQGRGHRMGLYRYNQSLPLKFSDTADVYIYSY